MVIRLCLVFLCILSLISCGLGQDLDSRSGGGGEVAKESAADDSADVELDGELQQVLSPLFESILRAKTSRATIEMLADSVLGGQVVQSDQSTFQIASRRPDRFTIYLKEPKQRTRLYSDGKKLIAAMAPDAYVELPVIPTIQEAVIDLPVPMGPYPEPLLALTMAGADPAISLVAGMKSVVLVDRHDFRNKVPAIHIRGEQADGVSWDFWVSPGETPRPLRLLIDLTPMLMASDQVHVPEGFSYQVRYDFLTWRITGEVEESLFTFTPAKGATRYASLEEYYQSIAEEESESATPAEAPRPEPATTGAKDEGKSLRKSNQPGEGQ